MNRFRNILAVYDTGPGSDEVLDQAVALARANGAQLTVVEPWEFAKPPNVVEEARRRLTRIEPWIAQQGVADVGTEILVGIPPAEIIRKVIADGHDLVIVSSESGRTIRDFVQGSTATNLMLKCPCDVWVLKPGQSVPCRNVVAAVDLDSRHGDRPDDLNAKIVDLAVSLAQAQDACLHVVHFWDVDGKDAEIIRSEIRPETTCEILDRHEARRQAALDALLARHAPSRLSFETHLHRGRPNINLAETAMKLSADVIIMGTAGRRGIQRFLMGNFSETVLNGGNCGVLAVKPDSFRTPTALMHRLAPEGEGAGRYAAAAAE
jgi:universal stress protein E